MDLDLSNELKPFGQFVYSGRLTISLLALRFFTATAGGVQMPDSLPIAVDSKTVGSGAHSVATCALLFPLERFTAAEQL
jgi:hypothetical protein